MISRDERRGGDMCIILRGKPLMVWDSGPAKTTAIGVDCPIGGLSPPEGRLAHGFKLPAFSRFLFQSAVKSAESF